MDFGDLTALSGSEVSEPVLLLGFITNKFKN